MSGDRDWEKELTRILGPEAASEPPKISRRGMFAVVAEAAAGAVLLSAPPAQRSNEAAQGTAPRSNTVIYRNDGLYALRFIMLSLPNQDLLTEEDKNFLQNGTPVEKAIQFKKDHLMVDTDFHSWNFRMGPDQAHRFRVDISFGSAGIVVSDIQLAITPKLSLFPLLQGMESLKKSEELDPVLQEPLQLPSETLRELASILYSPRLMMNPNLKWYPSMTPMAEPSDVRRHSGEKAMVVYPNGSLLSCYMESFRGRGVMTFTEPFHNPLFHQRNVPPPPGAVG